MARTEFAFQKQMRGLGDAVSIGREFVGTEPVFAVLLGDTVMQHGSPLGVMRAAWEAFQKPSVSLEVCAEERVSRYGVAGGREIGGGVFELDELVEKPAPERAPRLVACDGSRLPYHAFAARYLFTPEIFSCLEMTAVGLGGEIQLTDAMERLRRSSGMLGVTWPGRRLDIGSPAGLLESALAMES
jgi:UTP--glucose-1-phosphate uridylyltransferase